MKQRIIRIGVLPVFLLSAAALMVALALHAQTLETPPVKMGLWQTEVSTTFAGMPNMPAGHAMGDHKTTTQSCWTPETWKNSLEKFNDRQHAENCTTSNMNQSAHSISFDESCTADRGYETKMHFEAQFDSSESMTGKGTVVITGQAMPQGMTMNMTMNSKFLSSSCGDVEPGKAKIIR